MISPEAIKLIEQVIEKYHKAIIVKYSGAESYTPEEINNLLKENLIEEKDLTGSAVEDAYLIGRLRQIAPETELEKLSPSEFRQKYRSFISTLSDTQKQQLKILKERARTHLLGLQEAASAKIKGALLNISFEHTTKKLGKPIGEVIETAYMQNQTLNKIISTLQSNAKDYSSKWKTIAVTEFSQAINSGAADTILERNRDKDPKDIYVYFLTVPDNKRCESCHGLFLNRDGTPTVYKMSQILRNGTNYGKKRSEWRACIGGVHPNCRCVLTYIPDGWGFKEDSSQLTYQNPKYLAYKDQKK